MDGCDDDVVASATGLGALACVAHPGVLRHAQRLNRAYLLTPAVAAGLLAAVLLISLVDFSTFSASSQTLLPRPFRARAYDPGQNRDAAAGAVHGAPHSRAQWNAALGCPAFAEKHRSWSPNPVALQDPEATPCSELLVHVPPRSRA
ncbi:Os02g0646901 [Oryza sativa Japonica Group]|nr:Os02g0646901 [Oryza sativa Japonica Group]